MCIGCHGLASRQAQWGVDRRTATTGDALADQEAQNQQAAFSIEAAFANMQALAWHITYAATAI